MCVDPVSSARRHRRRRIKIKLRKKGARMLQQVRDRVPDKREIILAKAAMHELPEEVSRIVIPPVKPLETDVKKRVHRSRSQELQLPTYTFA